MQLPWGITTRYRFGESVDELGQTRFRELTWVLTCWPIDFVQTGNHMVWNLVFVEIYILTWTAPIMVKIQSATNCQHTCSSDVRSRRLVLKRMGTHSTSVVHFFIRSNLLQQVTKSPPLRSLSKSRCEPLQTTGLNHTAIRWITWLSQFSNDPHREIGHRGVLQIEVSCRLQRDSRGPESNGAAEKGAFPPPPAEYVFGLD